MAKKKKPNRITELLKVARRVEHDRYVDDLRDGRKLRPQTFADKRKKNNKNACRDRKHWN